MKGVIILIILGFLGICAETQDTAKVTCDVETEEKNKALARRFYQKVWFSNNPEVIEKLFAPEYVAHDIGDRKGIAERPEEQKKIAAFFWENGELSGSIETDC